MYWRASWSLVSWWDLQGDRVSYRLQWIIFGYYFSTFNLKPTAQVLSELCQFGCCFGFNFSFPLFSKIDDGSRSTIGITVDKANLCSTYQYRVHWNGWTSGQYIQATSSLIVGTVFFTFTPTTAEGTYTEYKFQSNSCIVQRAKLFTAQRFIRSNLFLLINVLKSRSFRICRLVLTPISKCYIHCPINW